MDGNRSIGTRIFSVDSKPLTAPGKPRRRFIDLFAGIGGFHLGMAAAGFEGVFASEIDAHAAAVYEANTGLKPHGDITQIDAGSIPAHSVLCAGFPCQAFSIAGNRMGFQDTRGTLFFEAGRIASAHQPEAMFLENVAGLVSHDHGRTLATIKSSLDDIGYTVFHDVINAAKQGSGTARERIYIVAFRKDLNVTADLFRFPAETGQRRSVADCLVSLTDEEISELRCGPVSAVDPKRLAAVKSQLARHPAQPVRIGTLGKGGQGYRIYSPEGVGITLSAYGGGAAAKTGAYLIDGVVRKLHPRECANLMDFPADFVIDKRPAQALKQFGNSVAVGVIKAIAREIERALDLVDARQQGAAAVADTGVSHKNRFVKAHPECRRAQATSPLCQKISAVPNPQGASNGRQ